MNVIEAYHLFTAHDGGVPLSAFSKDTTSELASFVFKLSFMLNAKQEAVNSESICLLNFKENVLNTILNFVLKYFFLFFFLLAYLFLFFLENFEKVFNIFIFIENKFICA